MEGIALTTAVTTCSLYDQLYHLSNRRYRGLFYYRLQRTMMMHYRKIH